MVFLLLQTHETEEYGTLEVFKGAFTSQEDAEAIMAEFLNQELQENIKYAEYNLKKLLELHTKHGDLYKYPTRLKEFVENPQIPEDNYGCYILPTF